MRVKSTASFSWLAVGSAQAEEATLELELGSEVEATAPELESEDKDEAGV